MRIYQIYCLPAVLRIRWEGRSEVVLGLDTLFAQHKIPGPSEVRWAIDGLYMLEPIPSGLRTPQSWCLTLKYQNHSPARQAQR
jgi:hypothetical protein